MPELQPELDALIGSWRRAFEAAERALAAAGRDHDLPSDELRHWSRRLVDQRTETVSIIGALLRVEHARPLLARLIASPRQTKQLLGLPEDVIACVFNVDGILVPSARIHADAWKETFDEFLAMRLELTDHPLVMFSRRADYPALIHGRSRTAAVRAFLATRGISLPEGEPDDAPGTETVQGLAAQKNVVLLRLLELHGVNAFTGARLYLQLARDAGVGCAVVSGSVNTRMLLEHARLSDLIDECIDGKTAVDEGLERKPAPDMLLAACRHLAVPPSRTAVFETTEDGLVAARAGGFEYVVAVDQLGVAPALRRHADRVATDLGEILELAVAR
jgi:beta-phosphoglucomutase-like phosphatase (HAD superfamily)